MAYSLTGLTAGSLSSIKTEESSKESGLFQMPVPQADSDDAVLLDLFGTSRTITITGVYVTGMTANSVAQFIVELDALCNGSQTSKTYASDKSGQSYTVLVNAVSWTANEGEVNSVEYSITMTEGTT